MTPRTLLILTALVGALAPAATAQDLAVTPAWTPDRYRSGRAPVDLTLSRDLRQDERLAVIVANTDVSAELEVRGRRARYRPTAWRLPTGESEVVAYLVTADGAWQEVGRAPLRVLTRGGLERSRTVPSLDLTSTGQLDQRVPHGDPAPPRRTYQDLTFRLGLESALSRSGWELAFRGNALGVTEETQRLRWGERQLDAPALDLADYQVRLARGGARLGLGHLATGANRHLVSGFSSRGLMAGAQLWRGAELEAAVLNGSNVVGWSNPFGLAQPDHRLAAATLSLELLPSRPGAIHLDISGLDGSLLPRSGFTQGSVTDAEESRGLGVQVALSDARQRIRVAGGFTRSRFVNPADALLFGDTAVVAVRAETRSARYGELALQLLQGVRLWSGTLASLGAAARHERVDPLYRSIGAWVQADRETNALDLTGSLGPLALQASLSNGRDNLAGIPSILTSHTRARGASVAVPLGQLLGAAPTAWFWPALSYAWQRTRQYGEGVPVNGEFAASHVPDQWSTNQTGSATWTSGAWNLAYRWNQSFQDNRQPGRERADFRAIVHGLSLGLPPWRGINGGLDASVERQKNFEFGTTQRTERVGANAQVSLTRTTTLSGALSQAWGYEPFGDQRSRNTELQAELSQGLDLYRRTDGGTQARVFLRYARTRAAFYPLAAGATPSLPRLVWTLNAGASIRLY